MEQWVKINNSTRIENIEITETNRIRIEKVITIKVEAASRFIVGLQNFGNKNGQVKQINNKIWQTCEIGWECQI